MTTHLLNIIPNGGRKWGAIDDWGEPVESTGTAEMQ